MRKKLIFKPKSNKDVGEEQNVVSIINENSSERDSKERVKDVLLDPLRSLNVITMHSHIFQTEAEIEKAM